MIMKRIRLILLVLLVSIVMTEAKQPLNYYANGYYQASISSYGLEKGFHPGRDHGIFRTEFLT